MEDTNAIHPSNVYIAGLPAQYNDRSLRMLFEPFGTIVSAKMMCTSTRQPNRVKGTGFVLFEQGPAAASAIQALNGTLLEGDPIQVRLAKVATSAPRHHAPPLAVPQHPQPQFANATAGAPMYLGAQTPTMVQQLPQQPKMLPASAFVQQPQQVQQVQFAPQVQHMQQGQTVFMTLPGQAQPQQVLVMPAQQQPQYVIVQQQPPQ